MSVIDGHVYICWAIGCSLTNDWTSPHCHIFTSWCLSLFIWSLVGQEGPSKVWWCIITFIVIVSQLILRRSVLLVGMPNLSCWWMQCKLKSLMSFRMVYSYLFSLTICSNLMHYNSITINGDLTITVILWLLSKLASCELNRSGCWNWNICSPVHLHLCTDPNLLISDI